MTTAIIVIVVVLLIAAAAAYLWDQRRKKERAGLQERFGPEYDRAVDETGNRRAAEHRLSDVAARRDKAEIRDLTPAERERFSERWTQAQADFVDDPAGAASSADNLVGEVMRERGYPLDDVDDRGDLVAADHAELAQHYRSAHAIGSRAHQASTEELRQAFVHYRALFSELLGGSDGRHAVAGPGAAAAATHAASTEDDVGAGTAQDRAATTGGGTVAEDRAATTDRTGLDNGAARTPDGRAATGDGSARGSELDGQQQLDLSESERTRTTPGRETPPA
jgi:hypothetical protein